MKSMLRKSWWAGAAFAALLLVVAPSVASAQTPYYFWWQTVDEHGLAIKTATAGVGDVQCSVFRPNVHGAAILHSNASLSNAGSTSPIFSDSNGRLHFYSTSSDPVDVTCYYAYGGATQVAKLDRFTHKIVVPRGQHQRITRFAVNSTAVSYQTDSGVALPGGALVRDVIIQNLNQRSVGLGAYHISVGLLGNHADGVANALVAHQALTSPVEWLRPHLVSFTAMAHHRGTVLSRLHGNNNYYSEVPFLVTSPEGRTVSYSAQPGDATQVAVRVHVYILWQQLHTGVNRSPALQ